MKTKTFILAFAALIVIHSCRKEPSYVEEKPKKIKTLSTKVKEFNFKTNSKWIFKNTIINSIDSMWVYSSTGLLTYDYGYPRTGYTTIEYYNIHIVHTLLPAYYPETYYYGKLTGIESFPQYYAVDWEPVFFEKNIGDTVQTKSSWNKIENIHSSILISGKYYTDVYEISYHPMWSGFTKVWWCPKVGFVKLEGTNNATGEFGIWELQSYNVILY